MVEVAYRLPESLRERLREPLGKVHAENELVVAIHGGRLKPPLIAVGDMVSDTLLRHGLDPRVIVYDHHTKRQTVTDEVRGRLGGHRARRVRVESAAATLSRPLVDAVRDAVRRVEPTRIQVEGEEDLATLPALAYAPLGATVIYGMPGRGLVAVPVTLESRKKAEDWLSLMKVG